KTVTVRVRPFSVWHLEPGDGHEAIAVHDTGRHVMSRSAVARLVRWLAAVQSNVDVFGVGGLKVIGHGGRAGWTVHGEQYGSAEHRRREHEIGESDGVIRMQVREKRSAKAR